ncbi:MAG: YitT family protein [Flavobacteriaceae bacterium]|jgi:uncharacterized membrane-anchored protein YitT (DUF2179 family)|nr:YitT family protein [Flavobacteriaceae bacterium]MCB0485277.1 YitT family protein [Flavobacteriaceae bacterium]
MIHFVQNIIYRTVKQIEERKKKNTSKADIDKKASNVEIEINHLIKEFLFILVAIASASFGLKGFLLPNSFIDGGVTGISLIVTALTKIPLSVLLVAINLPFIILARYTISLQLAVRSVIAIALLAISVHFVPFPTITDDKLLVAFFGGFFLGLGIGLAIRGGSVIDGTEILAVFISRKTGFTIGDIILLFNIIIFSVAAYVFSIEIALYAILTYLIASKTVDFVVSGIEEYVGVTIISAQYEEIRLMIIEKMGRGCTLYSGKRGFSKRGESLKTTEVVYTVLTRLELAKLKTEIDKIDKEAFIISHSIKDVKGGMIKKRKLV